MVSTDSDGSIDSPQSDDVSVGLARIQSHSDVAMWVGASLIQIQRFLAAYWDRPAGTRPTPNAWRSPLFVVEAHLLAVTANHVVTAMDALSPKDAVPTLSPEIRRGIELLRDIWEHWDEQRDTFGIDPVRSGKHFRDEFPDKFPWSFSYSADPSGGTRVGDVLQIEALAAELEKVAAALQPLLDQDMQDMGLLPYKGPIVDFAFPRSPASTPEGLAVACFGGRAVVAGCIQHDGYAVVLILAETEASSGVPHDPWFLLAHRGPAGWSGLNASGGLGGGPSFYGIVYVAAAAPVGKTSGSVHFQEKVIEVPVRQGYVMWAEFGAAEDEFLTITFE